MSQQDIPFTRIQSHRLSQRRYLPIGTMLAKSKTIAHLRLPISKSLFSHILFVKVDYDLFIQLNNG